MKAIWLVLTAFSLPALGATGACRMSGRHLVLTLTDPAHGKVTVSLSDYASLRENESLSWKIEPGSLSHVTWFDRVGFTWTPGEITPRAPHCKVELSREDETLEGAITCEGLKNPSKEIPGVRSLPRLEFSCPTDGL